MQPKLLARKIRQRDGPLVCARHTPAAGNAPFGRARHGFALRADGMDGSKPRHHY